ncbi:branched-chain amino acid ABC transporter permease [Castellaniella sp.]|uniref:branched-chain amino acid ABC transporter permease n=1 Tax=Castellaniella sp. TaxID=1955812 RepID=UPI003567E1DB
MKLNSETFVLLLVIAVLALVPLADISLRAILLLAISLAFPALGLGLLLRSGQVSFGHALYYAVGAYTVAVAQKLHVTDVFLTLALALAASMVLGLILGAILSRYRGIFYGMLNLAFSMVGFTLLLKLYDITGGSDGMGILRPTFLGHKFSNPQTAWAIYYLAVAVLVAGILFLEQYMRSAPGSALGAIRTNETRLEYLGRSARQVFLAGHVISAGFAGVGGMIIAYSTSHVTPELAYWTLSAEFLIVAIFGGAGSFTAITIGALAFVLLRNLISSYVVDAWQLILGIILLGIIMYMPDGLWTLFRKKPDAKAP